MDPTFPLLLLLWLQGRVSGIPTEQVYSKVRHFEGETLTVQCNFKHRKNHFGDKIWCKVRRRKCESGFTRVWAPEPRYLLQEDIKAKVVNITMAALMLQDSGKYWCMRNISGTLYPLMGFWLEVSAAPTTKRTTSLELQTSILKNDIIITSVQDPTSSPLTTTELMFTPELLTLSSTASGTIRLSSVAGSSFSTTRSSITGPQRTAEPQTVTATHSSISLPPTSSQAGSTTTGMCHTSRSLLNKLAPTRNQDSYATVLMAMLTLLPMPLMLIVVYGFWKKRHMGSYNICRVPVRTWKEPPGRPQPPWKFVCSEDT